MKKILLGLVFSCVFIGGSLYAGEGDLQVNGSVGVGGIAPNPTYKLDVNGASALRGTVWTSGQNIEVRGLATGNDFAYIDFRGDNTYTDYGLRLLRGNGGPNTWSELSHRGNGNLYIQTIDAAPLIFRTYSTDRMTVLSSGNVGIGTMSPEKRLHIYDPSGLYAAIKIQNSAASNSAVLWLHQSGSANGREWYLASRSTGELAIGNIVSGNVYDRIFLLPSNGNFGVATGAPVNVLSVLQSSPTDPIADSWTIYPCDRTTKEIIRTLPGQSGALDRLLAVDLYEWKRKPLVSDEEIKTEPEKVMTPDEMERRRQELSVEKSRLPKFQAKRVGVMLDDPNIPEEIISLDRAGQKGLDLVGYIGWLHATIKDLALRVQELEKR